jgi:hypothetical protein
MRQQHDVVGPLAPQLLQQANRRRELARRDVGGRVLQPCGVAAAEADHLVGPGIAPLRLAPGASDERRRRFVIAADAPVCGAEELQHVAIVGPSRRQPLEKARGAIVLPALQVDARQTDPAGAISRLDLGRAAERLLGGRDSILVESPQAEAPVRRHVRRIAIDRALHVARGRVDVA